MAKRNFLIPESLMKHTDMLEIEEVGRLFLMMIKYHRGEEIDETNRVLLIIFEEWKRGYNEMKARYDAACQRYRENGKFGGRPKKTKRNQTKPNETNLVIEEPNETKKTNDNQTKPNETKQNLIKEGGYNDIRKEDIRIEEGGMMKNEGLCLNNKKKDLLHKSEKERKVFIKPLAIEVDAYLSEMRTLGKSGYDFSGEAFIDFYESKGWMIGKNHMKDWKAACRTWAKGRNKQTDSRKLPTGHILDWDVNKELKDKTSDTFWES